jgi:hypothetical protein
MGVGAAALLIVVLGLFVALFALLGFVTVWDAINDSPWSRERR